jgi:hypothetical protein
MSGLIDWACRLRSPARMIVIKNKMLLFIIVEFVLLLKYEKRKRVANPNKVGNPFKKTGSYSRAGFLAKH